MTNYIKYALCNFKKIELKDMDSVKLMNRKECKYVMDCKTMASILSRVYKDYDVLEINRQRIMPYESRYFDYPNFNMYTTHQNGKLNRYKIRVRTYKTTGQKFLELKFKNNKMRTIKKRMEITKATEKSEVRKFFIKNYPDSFDSLNEVLKIDYNRITLVDKLYKERITIDLNLRYSSGDQRTAYEDLAIIEIKYEGDLKTSAIDRILKEKRIKPLSMSKYCLGIYQHYEDIKINRMKVKVREINKILKSGNPKHKYIKASIKAS